MISYSVWLNAFTYLLTYICASLDAACYLIDGHYKITQHWQDYRLQLLFTVVLKLCILLNSSIGIIKKKNRYDMSSTVTLIKQRIQ